MDFETLPLDSAEFIGFYERPTRAFGRCFSLLKFPDGSITYITEQTTNSPKRNYFPAHDIEKCVEAKTVVLLEEPMVVPTDLPDPIVTYFHREKLVRYGLNPGDHNWFEFSYEDQRYAGGLMPYSKSVALRSDWFNRLSEIAKKQLPGVSQLQGLEPYVLFLSDMMSSAVTEDHFKITFEFRGAALILAQASEDRFGGFYRSFVKSRFPATTEEEYRSACQRRITDVTSPPLRVPRPAS